jgi:hypothetical protein
MTKRKSQVKKKRTPLVLVAKMTPQVKNLIFHVAFLHKDIDRKRQHILEQQATISKQADLIRTTKAQLKKLKAAASKKTTTAAKSMKAK